MKKYFVCSDIHGFYEEFRDSLNEAGFDKYNPEHVLIVLGDLFDRGNKPWEVYQFLVHIPKERVILIKGNHEYLLEKLVKRKFPLDHDYTNGTYGTLVALFKDPELERIKWINDHKNKIPNEILYIQSYDHFYHIQAQLYRSKKINQILKWLNSSSWLNCYELGQYIFVHSFIPLKVSEELYGEPTKYEYFSDWRDCQDEKLWELSTWNCPYQFYLQGLFDEELKKGKILVCGHWHTSAFYNDLLYKDDPDNQLDIHTQNPIFKSNKYPGLIGLDACTVLTKKVNVFVINEDELKF